VTKAEEMRRWRRANPDGDRRRRARAKRRLRRAAAVRRLMPAWLTGARA
jgi:hypothetical protein